jgi:hypothetical protein
MVRMKRTLLGLLLMLLLVGGGTQAVAQSARPEGRVALESTSIAAGVGVDWGDGTLMGRIIGFQCPASSWATGESRRSMQWAMSIIWLDLQTLRAPMWPEKPGSQWLGGSMP